MISIWMTSSVIDYTVNPAMNNWWIYSSIRNKISSTKTWIMNQCWRQWWINYRHQWWIQWCPQWRIQWWFLWWIQCGLLWRIHCWAHDKFSCVSKYNIHDGHMMNSERKELHKTEWFYWWTQWFWHQWWYLQYISMTSSVLNKSTTEFF